MQNRSSFGRLFGSILLVAGCCIGVGMLSLPVVSAPAGWWPSSVAMVLGWLYMASSGWLLLEVALRFPNDTSVIEMAQRMLGKMGQYIAWACWMFLLYALMVAYTIGTGASLSDLLAPLIQIPPQVAGGAFAALLAVALVHGARSCDLLNRFLMVGLFGGYALLLFLGIGHVDHTLLQHHQWGLAMVAFPIMVISFGFQNLTPTLVYYLERNRHHLRIAILVGSFLPLLAYFAWQYVALGLVPAGAYAEGMAQGLNVAQVMSRTIGRPEILGAAQTFAICAVMTSFIAMALSMMDFMRDSFRMNDTTGHRWLLCSFVLVPCLGIAWSFPDLFLRALTFAGAYGAITLFGVLPSLMVLRGWQEDRCAGHRPLAWVILAASLGIIGLQFGQDVGWLTL